MEPDFGPGGGWHRLDGFRTPGCTADVKARRERAFQCVVLPIRDRGVRMPGAALKACVPLHGGLLMMPVDEGRWIATLFAWPAMITEMTRLLDAQLTREHDGVRQYVGLERGYGRERFPQTWICAPTREQLDAIVARMAERE